MHAKGESGNECHGSGREREARPYAMKLSPKQSSLGELVERPIALRSGCPVSKETEPLV